jgi:hypothetical protein
MEGQFTTEVTEFTETRKFGFRFVFSACPVVNDCIQLAAQPRRHEIFGAADND